MTMELQVSWSQLSGNLFPTSQVPGFATCRICFGMGEPRLKFDNPQIDLPPDIYYSTTRDSRVGLLISEEHYALPRMSPIVTAYLSNHPLLASMYLPCPAPQRYSASAPPAHRDLYTDFCKATDILQARDRPGKHFLF